ncbi:MAG: DinB family protein [Gemmataceae bacterium]
MTSKDLLKNLFDFNHMVMTTYLSDLADADLLVRPLPNANHAAWQLGHLISSEASMLRSLGSKAELPAGFEEQHSSKNASSDTGFLGKQAYLDLYGKVRQASLAALAATPETDYDKPNPHAATLKIAPTIGALLQLTANHEMMHAGQVAMVRRKLGKPILI